MPSFDVVSEVDMHELTNAVDQANREVDTRFDFKGTGAKFALIDNVVTLTSPSDFQLQQMRDILESKIIKRGIAIQSLDPQEPEVALNEARQKINVKQGLESEDAKKLVKIIKNSKLKVQASIQGEKIRITGKKRDDLQEAIAMLKESDHGLPLQYDNFRD